MSEDHPIVIRHLLILAKELSPKEFMWEMRKPEELISNSDKRLRSEKFRNMAVAKVLQ